MVKITLKQLNFLSTFEKAYQVRVAILKFEEDNKEKIVKLSDLQRSVELLQNYHRFDEKNRECLLIQADKQLLESLISQSTNNSQKQIHIAKLKVHNDLIQQKRNILKQIQEIAKINSECESSLKLLFDDEFLLPLIETKISVVSSIETASSAAAMQNFATLTSPEALAGNLEIPANSMPGTSISNC